jgi:acetamidase/formamidase
MLNRVTFRDIGLKYVLNPYDKPVLHVKSGETFVIEVEDATSGQIRNKEDQRDRTMIPFGNPVVGPIYVEGSLTGNVISVTIEHIKPTIGQGATYFSKFNENYISGSPIFRFVKTSLPPESKVCKIKNGFVYFSDKLIIPYNPMVGTIGVAPHPEIEAISSGVLPGRHGGNMDLPDLTIGSTIFLPVFHNGALIYLGDVHAAQGDGEISGTAIEMPAEVKVKVDLLDNEPINWPRIETKSEVMFVATTSAGRSLEDAIRTAFIELTIWMEEEYGLNRYEGLMLCSQVGKLRVGNLWTVAAKIDKKYLKALIQ